MGDGGGGGRGRVGTKVILIEKARHIQVCRGGRLLHLRLLRLLRLWLRLLVATISELLG